MVMKNLSSMTGKTLKDRVRNEWVKKECKLEEDVRVKVQNNIMRWFGHLERMDDERLTKCIYRGNVRGKRGRGRPRKEWLDQISEIVKVWDVQSECKRRKCMKKVMGMNELREVCQDRNKWRRLCRGSGHP